MLEPALRVGEDRLTASLLTCCLLRHRAFVYISPDGQKFSNVSAAQQHASRNGGSSATALDASEPRSETTNTTQQHALGPCARDTRFLCATGRGSVCLCAPAARECEG
jgi:hypothetical protein